jgi:hypothetical protein
MAKKLAKVQPTGDKLFSVRVPLGGESATVIAYEHNGGRGSGNHTRIDLELRFRRRVVFPPGSLWCGIPSHQSIDGKDAKRAAVSSFSLKPGDTDREFFDAYTPEQLAFVEQFGEEIGLFVYDRYGE